MSEPKSSLYALPKYRSHKVVQAAKITEVETLQVPHLVLDVGISVPVDPKWLARHDPKVGGYYVVYPDGYTSYSPADAFESGHTPEADSPTGP